MASVVSYGRSSCHEVTTMTICPTLLCGCSTLLCRCSTLICRCSAVALLCPASALSCSAVNFRGYSEEGVTCLDFLQYMIIIQENNYFMIVLGMWYTEWMRGVERGESWKVCWAIEDWGYRPRSVYMKQLLYLRTALYGAEAWGMKKERKKKKCLFKLKIFDITMSTYIS